jgi:tetratricopeptide (TPR) repeat protein
MPKMDCDDDDMPPPLINIEGLLQKEPMVAAIPVMKTPEIIPQTSEEWKIKGDDSYRSKDYQKAVDSYSQAINNQIDKNASYYLNRAASYLMLGNYQEVLKDCDMAISIEPNNPKPYFRKATALKSIGRFEDARKALTDGLVLDPSSTTATSELNNLNNLKIKIENLYAKMEKKQYRILLPEIDAVIRLTGSRYIYKST